MASEKTQAILEERRANTAARTAELEAQGYHAEDATVSIVKANIMAFLVGVPFLAVFVLLFWLLHPGVLFWEDINGPGKSFLLLVLLALSVPIHEGFHGLGWVTFCKDKWKSIQFGVMWDSFTPYCHCREPLSVAQYYVGLFLPCTMLGWIPCILAVIFGSGFWLIFGLMGILLAGGDLTIGCIIFKYLGKDARILDHPDQCGAVAFKRG